MTRIKNKKVINRLTKRTLKSAKLRNIMAIIAIALTTILFTSLFTLGIGTVESFQQATMRQSGSSAHGIVKYIDERTFDDIKDHELINSIGYNRILADSVDNEEFLKRHGELWYLDDNGFKNSFYEPTCGSRPIMKNEIIMDTKTMELLNLPKEIGADVKIKLTVHEQEVERDFKLSGWWEQDPSFNASILITSKAYMDEYKNELYNSYKDDHSLTGVINAEINFKNPFNIEGKLNRVISESGYQNTDVEEENYLTGNINWAYISSGIGGDLVTTVILIIALILILLTGYLIIYNIFQISVIRDIRFYGLLKTVGTTGKQIKSIIGKQALLLSVMGIPIGLIIGYFLGRELVPAIIARTSYSGYEVEISANPLIFIGASIFSLITVWISTRKPGRIAARVSPVEAVKYTDMELKKRGEKKSTNGGKLSRISLANLGRNKKRTILVFLSLSLSLVVLNSVVTLSKAMDMDKFLSTFVDTDFLVGHAEYFNSHYRGEDESPDENMIAAIEEHNGFLEGGKLYNTDMEEVFTVEDEDHFEDVNIDEKGNPFVSLYGFDDLVLNRLEIIDGELDMKKLKSGKYIIYGITTDDNHKPVMEEAMFKVGDKVVIHNNKLMNIDSEETEYTTNEFEVLARVKVKSYSNTNRMYNVYNLFLPSEIYLPLTEKKAVMSYGFNVKDGYEKEMEEYLKDYTENISPLMSYESKGIYMDEFSGIQNLFLSIGGILSFIIGVIGILNFINAMLTSIITRRVEFAMLESIGMTKGQIKKMVSLEGLYYGLGTIIISFTLGILTSIFLFKPLLENLWFMTYGFTITPLLISWPFLILLGILVPILSVKLFMKDSIVERLRLTE